MKNVVFGVIGCYLIIYVSVISISLFGIYSRKNELNNCVADVLEHQVRKALDEMAEGTEDREADQRLMTAVEKEIRTRLGADAKIEISYPVCDLRKGIVSIKISEQFSLPGSKSKTIYEEKTLVIDSV